MPDLSAHCRTICHRLAAELAGGRWVGLAEPDRLGQLPDLLERLLRIACEGLDRGAAHREMLSAAHAHGVQRAHHGLDEQTLLEEFYIVRRETYAVLKDVMPYRDLERAIFRFDSGASDAMLESLRGLHALDPGAA